jgi:hypothetical protein
MMRFTHRPLALAGALLALVAPAATPAFAQSAKPAAPQAATAQSLGDPRDVNLRAYAELIRSDIRAQKVGIITAVMAFSEEEDAKFWPVYREYETELAKINDDRLALITQYAETYATMTDAIADKLVRGALDVETRRTALKAKYYDRLKTVVSPKTAARAIQVENQILLLLDLQIAAALPIVE